MCLKKNEVGNVRTGSENIKTTQRRCAFHLSDQPQNWWCMSFLPFNSPFSRLKDVEVKDGKSLGRSLSSWTRTESYVPVRFSSKDWRGSWPSSILITPTSSSTSMLSPLSLSICLAERKNSKFQEGREMALPSHTVLLVYWKFKKTWNFTYTWSPIGLKSLQQCMLIYFEFKNYLVLTFQY